MQTKHIYHHWLLIGLLAVLVLTASGCQAALQDAAAQESTSETLSAFIGDLSASTGATGKLVAMRSADLTLDGAGEVTDVPVKIGGKVAAGELLVQHNSSALRRAVLQAEQNVLSLTSALADLQMPPIPIELASAETAVSAAQARLAKLNNGPTADEIGAAEANVQAAQANVWAAVNRLNAAQDGANDADVQAAQLAANEAQRQFDTAHNAYIDFSNCKPNDNGTHDCTLDRGKEGSEVIQWRAVEAQANLERAQAILTNLRDGNPDNIAVAQAGGRGGFRPTRRGASATRFAAGRGHCRRYCHRRSRIGASRGTA